MYVKCFCTVLCHRDCQAVNTGYDIHVVRLPLTNKENNIKLDGQGKARREAARRRNSECKINLSCRNSSRGNGSRPTTQW